MTQAYQRESSVVVAFYLYQIGFLRNDGTFDFRCRFCWFAHFRCICFGVVTALAFHRFFFFVVVVRLVLLIFTATGWGPGVFVLGDFLGFLLLVAYFLRSGSFGWSGLALLVSWDIYV